MQRLLKLHHMAMLTNIDNMPCFAKDGGETPSGSARQGLVADQHACNTLNETMLIELEILQCLHDVHSTTACFRQPYMAKGCSEPELCNGSVAKR
jgi:hypothetical protein